MITEFTVAIERQAKARRDSEADVTIASVWLALYLVIFVRKLAESFVTRALQFAALY